MAEEDIATVIFPAPPFEEGPTLLLGPVTPELIAVAPMRAGPQEAIMAPRPEGPSVRMQ